jgi:threonine dehydrogenase-like Zn-dependent dehydrogenase
MRAIVIEAPGRAGLGTLAEPTLAEGQVLLRVRTVGFCGSDLNTFRGLNPLVSYPRVPGHEIAGVVEAVGIGVPGEIREGTQVTVVPYTACGKCSACRRGRVNTCRDNQTLGVQRDGALTERIALPWQTLITGEGLDRRELALVEPLAVGFHAVARGRVAEGDVVAVIGTGAVGLGAVAGAVRAGGTVIAVDVDDAKLTMARRSGATHVVNSRTGSLHERLQELTGGDGPDVVIEAVGLPETSSRRSPKWPSRAASSTSATRRRR